MLNDRERQVLARIENDFARTDPAFVRLFSSVGQRVRVPARSMHAAGPGPCLMLVCGLMLIVAGGITAMAPVAVAGATLCLLALGVAHILGSQSDQGFGFA